MSENPRDTQFMGFAKGVWDEITATLEALEAEHEIADGCLMCNWTPEKIAQVVEPIIAKHAYGMAEHVLGLVPHLINMFSGTQRLEDVIPYIPDLTELPKEQSS